MSTRCFAREDPAIMERALSEIVENSRRDLPGRLAHNAMISRFILEILEARLRWVEHARAWSADWVDAQTGGEEKQRSGLASFQRDLERIRELLGQEEEG